MLYIARPGLTLPQNTPQLTVHTDKASSEARFVSKMDSPEFKPGDVLYVLRRDGTVTKHSFHKPFNMEEQDAYNVQCRIRDRERQFARLRMPIEGAFDTRISNRLSGRRQPIPWKIVTFGDLVRRSEGDLRSIGLGRESMSFIRDILSSQGLMLGMLMYEKVDKLGLSLRAVNALMAHNVMNVEDLLEQSRTDVRFATQSEKVTKEIEDTLAKMGFSFAS